MSVLPTSAPPVGEPAAGRELPGEWLASLGDPRADAQHAGWTIVTRDGRFRALSLLAGGEQAQPSTAQARSCGVIFDGVLHNRAELGRDLEPTVDQAENEASLALRSYLRWGEDGLRKIKGHFALLLWDSERDLFLCARDPIGIYPLFYAQTERELVLSTSIEALLRHPRVSRAFNRPAIADQLRFRFTDLHETVYESVNRVPPGHALRMARGHKLVYRYWDPASPYGRVNWLREDELGRFDQLLDQAVNRCLPFGPAGIFLSGGLDSVTVAAVSTEKCREQGLPDPLALSLVFPHPEANEEIVQRSVARCLGLRQVVIPFDEAVAPRGLVPAALEMSSRFSMPLMNTWLPAYRHLGEAGRQRGCRTILTGTGGDEWLTVTPFLAADLLRRADVAGFYQLWRSMHQSVRRSPAVVFRLLLWKCGLKPLLIQALRQAMPEPLLRARRSRIARRIPSWLAPDPAVRRELIRRGEQMAPESESEKAGFYIQEMRSALDHPLVSWELEESFENARSMGVRVLHPFWDSDLVDLLYRIPPLLLNKGGRSKGLVRESLARRFPDLGFEKQKKVEATGFFWSVILTKGAQTWHELGGPRALAELGLVDPQILTAEIDDIVAKNYGPEAYRIIHVLTYEAWLRPRL